MRVKITQKGWETYSSDIGGVQFENGVSVSDISRSEAMALGAFVSIVEIDEDGNEKGVVSPAEELLRVSKMSARVDRSTLVNEFIQKEPSDATVVENLTDTVADDPIIEARALQLAAEKPVQQPKVWSQAELEAIASANGIKGLREISPPGVKNTSIKGLIDEILAAQAKG